jgi:glycine cleavage system transcriptional repressor
VNNYLIVSAVGEDRPGLADALARTIFECACSIQESRLAVLGGEFTVVAMVRGNWNTLAKLEAQLKRLEQSLDLAIIAKRTGERARPENMLPYAVEVIAMDHPGIVHALANFFSSRAISIEDMVTRGYSAPHTGTPMFSVNLVIGIPAAMQVAVLREEFMDFCDELNLDAVIEPVRG